jgi:ATP-dependent DNA helicase RecG
VEIYNPGTFPAGISPQEFIDETEPPVHRNPLLAQIMYYPKEVETFGTGLRRIHDYCVNAGVKYEFKLRKRGFAVVFYRPREAAEDRIHSKQAVGLDHDYTPQIGGVNFGLTVAQIEILNKLSLNPQATAQQLSDEIGKTKRSIEYQISKLKNIGLLEREGADKNGRWIVRLPGSVK